MLAEAALCKDLGYEKKDMRSDRGIGVCHTKCEPWKSVQPGEHVEVPL